MRVLAVVGPTAVGKSALAVRLAKKYNGEIISCDSMQIYRGMDIGTAKPTPEELAASRGEAVESDPFTELAEAAAAPMEPDTLTITPDL